MAYANGSSGQGNQSLVAGWQDVDHGDACSCRLLAAAVGAGPAAVDFAYCRIVLQRHWRLRCNHGCRDGQERERLPVPELDAHDPLHAILLVNGLDRSG